MEQREKNEKKINKPSPPQTSAGQQELNLIRLKMQIEEAKKQAAKEKAFKAVSDAMWDRIKKERAEKKKLRESRSKRGKK